MVERTIQSDEDEFSRLDRDAEQKVIHLVGLVVKLQERHLDVWNSYPSPEQLVKNTTLPEVWKDEDLSRSARQVPPPTIINWIGHLTGTQDVVGVEPVRLQVFVRHLNQVEPAVSIPVDGNPDGVVAHLPESF